MGVDGHAALSAESRGLDSQFANNSLTIYKCICAKIQIVEGKTCEKLK